MPLTTINIENIAGVRLRHPSANRTTRPRLSPQKQLEILLETARSESEILNTFKRELREYAKANLNKVGTDDYYTTAETNVGSTRNVAPAKTTTKTKRETAVNLLFGMLSKGSVSTNELYQY